MCENRLNELASELHRLLTENKLTLSVAESFTGGTIASSLVKIPGASKFFREGIVCYSNDSKHFRLGVRQDILATYGAVSEQVAEAMARGLLLSPLKPDFVIATTGNADIALEKTSCGGEAYVAVGNKQKIYVEKLFLDGERNENIITGAVEALKALLNLVKK